MWFKRSHYSHCMGFKDSHVDSQFSTNDRAEVDKHIKNAQTARRTFLWRFTAMEKLGRLNSTVSSKGKQVASLSSISTHTCEPSPKVKLLIANNNLLTKHYHNRPSLEARSTSQFNVRNTCMSPIDESDEITPRKHTEMIDSITDTLLNIPEAFTVQSSQSTPMIVALSDQIHLVHGTKKPISTTNDTSKKQQEKELRRERHQTKRGLLMTKPE